MVRARSVERGRAALALIPEGADLGALAEAARGCRACPLYQDNAGTVFGEGPARGALVLVGEQPGDVEDRQGRPFVGPAGRVLDECMAAAGLTRANMYLTNAVKHFAHRREGKKRLHQRPKASEADACAPWLRAELAVVAPRVVVALGATAAAAIFGAGFSITRDRGAFRASELAPIAMATFHPSAVLRMRAVDPEGARAMWQLLVDDLRAAGERAGAAARGDERAPAHL